MWGNFRRQAAQGCGDEIRRDHDGKKGAGDFAAWMARTRQEGLNEQRDHEEEGKNDPADPPGNRRPAYMDRGLLLKLKKEQAGRGEDGAGEKEFGGAEQVDAVLSALERDHRG